MKVIDEGCTVRVVDGKVSAVEMIREVVGSGQEDPFYVMDMGEVVRRYHYWKQLMPRVEPFYAVKCNDDKLMVSILAGLGAGFDCASKREIELVQSLGVDSERIIFANPAKMASHIRHAAAVGVDMMTFDSEPELMKIKRLMPHARLVIRIRCDAEHAQCPLGIKFGCDPVTEAPRLLKLATVMGLQVAGVSFHVGSGANETAVYSRAIQLSRALFTLGGQLGHHMTLLDLGGGYPGLAHTDIAHTAMVINQALSLHFPSGSVRVIAEPGRYFAAAAFTLATMVHATRQVANTTDEDVDEKHTMYFVNDGVYGSFNCILYDHADVVPQLLEPSCEKPLPCSIWGPSCDGLDCIIPAGRLPALSEGSWIIWRDMGAYTLPVASPFNGFALPTVKAVIDAASWEILREVWPEQSLPLMEYSADSRRDSACEMAGDSLSDSPCGSTSNSPCGSPQRTPLTVTHSLYVECALK